MSTDVFCIVFCYYTLISFFFFRLSTWEFVNSKNHVINDLESRSCNRPLSLHPGLKPFISIISLFYLWYDRRFFITGKVAIMFDGILLYIANVEGFLSIVASIWIRAVPANIYLLKVNNRNTIRRCEICLKLTIKTPDLRQWRRSGVFIVTLNILHTLF